MPHFVGSERLEIVDAIVAQYDACVTENRPHLVSITAEVGWGKTRIVQELYGRLQKDRQPNGRYWTGDLLDVDDDPMRGRKVIYPLSAEPDHDAQLPWLWWGLRCEVDSGGRRVRALFNDRAQLQVHLAGLIDAASRRAGNRELALGALGEAIGFIPGIGNAVSLAMASVQLGPKLARRLMDSIRRGQDRLSSTSETRTVSVDRPDAQLIEPELDVVRQLISPELPLVLAIDDAHDADGLTVEFVGRVLSLHAPILVVTTAWPSALADQAEEEREREEPEPRTFGGLVELLRQTRPEMVTSFELSPLGDPDLGVLIRDVAPATNDRARSVLLESCAGNPLVLRLQLTSPRVTRSIVHAGITLTPDELQALPRKFERLIGERYDDLELPEQEWLAEAAVQGAVFFPELMSKSCSGLDDERLAAFTRRRPVDVVAVGQFIEEPVYRAILAAAVKEFTDREREGWALDMLIRQQEWWMTAPRERLPGNPMTRRSFCRLALSTAERLGERPEIDERVIAEAAKWLSFTERDLERHEAELEAAQLGLVWARRSRDARTDVALRMRLSAAYRASNDGERAATLAKEAVDLALADARLVDQRGEALVLFAQALAQNDDLDAARAAVRAALEHACDDDLRVWALGVWSRIEDDAGAVEVARAKLEEALELARRREPLDLEDIILIETDLADLESDIQPARRWRELAEMAELHVGAGHWLHLYCLDNLGLRLSWGEGRLAEAEAVLAQLVALGESEARSESLTAMGISTMNGDLSQVAAFVARVAPYSSRRDLDLARQVSALLTQADMSVPGDSQLSPVHRLLAVLKLAPTDIDAAIDELVTLLDGDVSLHDALAAAVQVSSSVLGDTLIARAAVHPRSDEIVARLSSMVAATSEFPPLPRRVLDDYCDAVCVLRGAEVIDRQPLGVAMVDLRAAAVVAVALHARGHDDRAAAALAEGRALLSANSQSNMWRLLGRAHLACSAPEAGEFWRAAEAALAASVLDRLIARDGRADALTSAGRHEDALPLRREVLAGFRTERGDAHPTTVTAILDLAGTLYSLGQFQECRDLEAEAVQIRRETLGPEHRATVAAMGLLADTYQQLGENDIARTLYGEVLDWRRRTLGEADPSTVLAMAKLAESARTMNDLDTARRLGDEVVLRRRSTLGADHPLTLEAEAAFALTLFRLAEYAPCRAFEEHVLQVRRTTLGDDDDFTVVAKANLAQTLVQLRDYGRARVLWQEIVDTRRALVGEDHDQTLSGRARLAEVMYYAGDLTEAQAVEEEVVRGYARTLGPDEASTRVARINLGMTLRARGAFKALHRLEEENLASTRRAVGPDASETLSAEVTLATTLANLGEHGRAATLWKHVVSEYERQLGANHATTRHAREALRVAVELSSREPPR